MQEHGKSYPGAESWQAGQGGEADGGFLSAPLDKGTRPPGLSHTPICRRCPGRWEGCEGRACAGLLAAVGTAEGE